MRAEDRHSALCWVSCSDRIKETPETVILALCVGDVGQKFDVI